MDSHQGRLVVVDISDPTQPTVLSRNTLFADEDRAGSLAVNDDGVFVAFRSGWQGPDLVVFNHYHSAPGRPEITVSRELAADPLRVKVHTVPGVDVEIQRSENLFDWTDWIGVRMGPEPLELMDPQSTDASRQFYRALVR
jgi:hypothetical protein